MISIIVPVYNCISSLPKCVDSILNQTFTDLELLLIDDGSVDGSSQLCDNLASEDSRIRVFHKLNGGVSSARNMGLEHARGEHVMFCDSDDWAEPEWCERLYFAAIKYPGFQPVCNYYRNIENLETVNRKVECGCLKESIEKVDFFSLNQFELLGIPWNKIYLRSILENNRIRFWQDLSLGEDLIFNLDYLRCQENGYVFVNDPLYHYIQGSADSLSSKYYSDLVGIYRTIYVRIKKELDNISGAYEKWGDAFFHSFFFAFDRVFRNTWSKKNPDSLFKKWRYNIGQFHSEDFQKCRMTMKKNDINKWQFYALQTNCFCVYWIVVVMSEIINRWRNDK